MAEGRKSLDSLLDEALADLKASGKPSESKKGNPEEDGSGPKGQQEDVMRETLKILQDSVNSFSLDDSPTEEELEKMFADLSSGFPSGETGSGDPESFQQMLPMMEAMMQSLLSKELLYPALKELSTNYPDWLAEKRQSLDESEFDRFNRQFQVTKQLCHEFERQDEGGVCQTEDGKKKQFDKVFELMQEMQSFGNPPPELVQKNSQGRAGIFGTFPKVDEIFDASWSPVETELPNNCKTS